MGELERLARERFTDPPLTESERRLVSATATGGIANCAWGTPEETWRPTAADKWGPEREIRAALLRWLCVAAAAKALVDPAGIQLWSAQINDCLDLSFVKVPFPIAMINCLFVREINLMAAEIPDVNLHGTLTPGIEASGLHVRANVFLRHGFTSNGEVRLLGARIGGDLDCSGAVFLNPGPAATTGRAVALSADRVEVGGGAFLNGDFHAEGEVRFPTAEIRGNFSCSGGTFTNQARPGGDACALGLDGMTVGGDMFLNKGFRSDGEVRLLGARIGGNLDCSGGHFANSIGRGRPNGGHALSADGVVVKECVFLTDGFSADGGVGFAGAEIEKNFECIGATFRGPLGLRGASVRGGFHWLEIKEPELATLLLDDASTPRVLDDRLSWPANGKLDLDGFVYQRFAQGPRDHRSRLDWIERQRDFTPQPYRQLAKVLRDEGDESGAKEVLYRMAHRTLTEKKQNAIQRFWGLALRGAVGYGYYPGRAVIWLAGIVATGFLLFWFGYATRSMTPTDTNAYAEFRETGSTPPYYERFHALMYSVENTAPLVKFGQVDRWQPDPNPQRFVECLWATSSSLSICVSMAGFLRWVRWIQTLLGWILATFFVAGVTGIVRKD